MSFDWKNVGLNYNVNILHSGINSTGKTTLMRAILFTFGFSIPSTELIKFDEYEFEMVLFHNKKDYTILRKKHLLTINGKEYDLPTEIDEAHSALFGTGNYEILHNLLGTIYFDQEKGWTLLNRGKIIGENRFSIESFFRGLNDDESDASYRLAARLAALNKKVAQYKLMLSVAEYQDTLTNDVEQKLYAPTYKEKQDAKLTLKRQKLDEIDKEISDLCKVISKNKSFADYIAEKRVYINNPNGNEPIRITKKMLYGFEDLEEVNIVRKNLLTVERGRMKREIATLVEAQYKEEQLIDLTTVDEDLTHRLATVQNLSSIQVKSILDNFKKQWRETNDALKQRTKNNNTWITDAYKIISDYSKELKIPFDYKIDIFTSNLKAKSGAILYKMVSIYKLAYIKLLSQKLGYNLPIFCDSPWGREVEKSIVEEVLGIIKRDFVNHQLIIASLYEYNEVFPNANIILMNGTLFNEQELFDE
jgi:hypothetical protein